MPTCANCAHKWSYLETLKGSFNLTNRMTCPNCKKKQYPTKKTRNLTLLFTMITVFITFGTSFLFGPSVIILVLLFVLFAAMMTLYPFIVELSNEEMPI